MVKGGIEHPLVALRPCYLNAAQGLLPTRTYLLQLRVEVAVRDIPPRLLGADIRDTHLHIDDGIRKLQPLHSFRRGGRPAKHLLVAQQTEVDGIGVAIVPAATNTGEAAHLMVADHFHLSPHELLPFAQVRHAVLAQEMGGVNQQRPLLRIVYAVEGTALRSRHLRADAVLEGRGIIAEGDILRDAPLRDDTRLDEDIAVLLSATRAADVRLRESRHHLGHRCPTRIRRHPAVWSRLTHAEGHRRSGERASHSLATDTRVDILPNL